MTRSQEEIAARYDAVKDQDMFGWRAEILLYHLDFEHARPFLKPEATAEDWEPARDSMDPAALLEEIRSYLDFAWGKAADHRGISAERSIQKLTDMVWLTGHEQAMADLEAAPYPQYGAPKLAVIAAAFELPVPAGSHIARMIAGEQCRAPEDPYYPCDEGCGR